MVSSNPLLHYPTQTKLIITRERRQFIVNVGQSKIAAAVTFNASSSSLVFNFLYLYVPAQEVFQTNRDDSGGATAAQILRLTKNYMLCKFYRVLRD